MASRALNANDMAALPSSRASPDFQKDLVALIPFLRAFSRSLCRSKEIAEDMAQEALVKAWRARDRFEPGSNLKAWLFTILRHEFYSHRRRVWREMPWDEELSLLIASPPKEQEWAMELSDTARALDALPKPQREAVILVVAGGFTYSDAGKICSTAEGSMKSRVARGRATLSSMLDGDRQLPPRSPLRTRPGFEAILSQLAALTPAPTARTIRA